MFLDVLPPNDIHFDSPPIIETTAKAGEEAATQISKFMPATFIIAFLIIVAVVVIAAVTKVINKELKNA